MGFGKCLLITCCPSTFYMSFTDGAFEPSTLQAAVSHVRAPGFIHSSFNMQSLDSLERSLLLWLSKSYFRLPVHKTFFTTLKTCSYLSCLIDGLHNFNSFRVGFLISALQIAHLVATDVIREVIHA